MEKIISVSELTYAISAALNKQIGSVTVQGEISNFKPHSSGHRYFTLKDEGAQIACVMWRSRQLSIPLVDGMKVIIKGELTVYAPQGKYQIDCFSVTPLGQGDLYLAYEALKKKLEALGYFDVKRKRQLPEVPLNIGVSTSPTGAAVKDIISTIERRLPACTVYFRPTLVQGEGSSEDIAAAITELNKLELDVIIIGRGGGSLEDLWSFNTELVAKTIFQSETPIISAVGHETDFTISDFVADIRAATPTAAAELATSHTMNDFSNVLDSTETGLKRTITDSIQANRDLISNLQNSYPLKRFVDKIRTFIQQTDEIELLLAKNFKRRFKSYSENINSVESHLNSLHPYAPLKKGFALLKQDDKLIYNNETLKSYKVVNILRLKETAEVSVLNVTENENL